MVTLGKEALFGSLRPLVCHRIARSGLVIVWLPCAHIAGKCINRTTFCISGVVVFPVAACGMLCTQVVYRVHDVVLPRAYRLLNDPGTTLSSMRKFSFSYHTCKLLTKNLIYILSFFPLMTTLINVTRQQLIICLSTSSNTDMLRQSSHWLMLQMHT